MFDPGDLPKGLHVPARNLPVPETPSPQIQKLINAPLRPGWNILPKSDQEWQQVVDAGAAATLKTLPGLMDRMKVKFEKTTIDGVRAFIVTPGSIGPNNRHRVLIHMHGGCYVFSPGESGLREAVMMAGLSGFRVISVDYRMPPEAYFPAALDDGFTVYKHALETTDPKRVAIFGTSAGGALTLAIVLRAKQGGIPVPAAIAPGNPMSDVTGVGDTFHTNELVDNVLVSRDGFCQAAAQYYAAGHDMKDPLISPVYGDLAGFPPTILTSGTRDLLLSNTVRFTASCDRPAAKPACRSLRVSRTLSISRTTALLKQERHSPRSAPSSISIWPVSRKCQVPLAGMASMTRMSWLWIMLPGKRPGPADHPASGATVMGAIESPRQPDRRDSEPAVVRGERGPRHAIVAVR